MGFLDKLFGRAKTTAEEAGSVAPEAGAAQALEPPVVVAGGESEQTADTVVELAEHDEADDAPADPAGPGPAAA